MDARQQRLLMVADRVLMHLEHQIPPEVDNTRELRELVDELMREAALDQVKRPPVGGRSCRDASP